jgi:uncharacterized phage protein gp47/JayE
MSSISLSDLLSTKTLEKWKQSIVATATAQSLSPDNWAEGAFMRSMLALFAYFYAIAGDAVKLIAAGGFLDFAEGKWLTLLAKQVFNVDRIEATFAAAPSAMMLTNAGGGIFVYDAGDIVFSNPATKQTYRNTSGGTLSAGGTLTLDLIAEEAGNSGSSGVGTITELVTTSLGVTCTNIVALVGVDEEKDPALRVRCRESLGALSIGGPKKAYEFFAKSAKRTDGTAIGVTRVRPMTPPGDGTIDIIVAGAAGAVSDPDVAIIQALFDSLATPYGFNATAVSASNLSVSAPCTIWIPASLAMSEADARQAVFNALELYINTAPIGGVVIAPATGKIYWRALLGVVAGAIPGTLKAQLTSEVDIDVLDTEVPVWTGLLAETTVNQVSGA